MALTYALPLTYSCFCTSPSSSSGVLGGASSKEFSAARNVLPVYASSSFSRVGGRKGTFEAWRLVQGSRGQERRRTSSLGNHETKDASPNSLYLGVPQVNASNKPVEASLGCGEAPKFWSYGASKSFRDYASPKWHGAPNNYGISGYSAESGARVTAVEAIEPSTGLVEGGGINADSTEEAPEPALGGGGTFGPSGGGNDGPGNGGGSGSGKQDPKGGLSTSQILTLVYAALVFVGGLIGYAKSGSSKSLLTGGAAALALLVVYAQLPIRPTTASALGLVISAVLLGVMFPRFKSSGKFLPAGLVTVVSAVMTGGYLHGIVRASR